MKKLLIICAILSLCSCDITKSATKRKADITSTELVETKTTRVGDTLRIEIPKVTYKDTTIVKTNYINRTEARIRYDAQGNADVECISAEINEFKKEMRSMLDNSVDKSSEKEESFNSEIILYALIGIAIIICGALFVFLNFASRQSKLIEVISSKIL